MHLWVGVVVVVKNERRGIAGVDDFYGVAARRLGHAFPPQSPRCVHVYATLYVAGEQRPRCRNCRPHSHPNLTPHTRVVFFAPHFSLSLSLSPSHLSVW